MQRILVVANRTCPCPGLHAFVHEQVGEPPGEIAVVAPALNSRLRHWISDSDAAHLQAQARVDEALDGLKADGIAVTGTVGDAEPLQAIQDALARFPADAIIVSTHPDGRSHWLERGLVEKARAALDIPITHYVTEYGLEGVEPPPAAT